MQHELEREAVRTVAPKRRAHQRAMLVRYACDHIRHMQKALEQMNVKLTQVVTDITGMTGMGIIRAILGGEGDSVRLAALRDERCKNTEETIARALEGNWRSEHLFELRQALELFDFYEKQLGACDNQIEAHLRRFEDKSGGQELPVSRKPKSRRGDPGFDARLHLLYLTGVDVTTIIVPRRVPQLALVSRSRRCAHEDRGVADRLQRGAPHSALGNRTPTEYAAEAGLAA
jgi:hypothetical protein